MSAKGRQALTAVLGILALAIPWRWPDMPMLAQWILWPLAAILLGYAVFDFVATKRHLPWKRLSLSDAASLMYRKADPSLRTIITRLSRRDEDGPIAWGREVLVVAAREGLLDLWGQLNAKLQPEKISTDRMKGLFPIGDDRLGYPIGGKADYVNVTVRRSDALKVLNRYSLEGDDQGTVHPERQSALVVSDTTVAMAGVVHALLERAGRFDFRWPKSADDPFVGWYEQIRDSTDPVWIEPAVNQLRREVLHCIGLLGSEDVHYSISEAQEWQDKLRSDARALIAALSGKQP